MPASRIQGVKLSLASDLTTLVSFTILQTPANSRRDDRRSVDELTAMLKQLTSSVHNADDTRVDAFLRKYLDTNSQVRHLFSFFLMCVCVWLIESFLLTDCRSN